MALATAVTFVWLGMVLAISFLETPLKFRAPGVTLQIGLGIGRLVFRVLNLVEVILGAVLLIALLVTNAPTATLIAAIVVAALLVMQITLVRPRLALRSDRILAGETAPRSRAHYEYVAFESMKAVALAVTGALLLAA